MISALFPSWLRQIGPRIVKQDLLAGLTGAIGVLPQGVAFATIAGLPPEYGLYTAMVPALVGAWFGSSLHLITGPTTAAAILLYSFLSGMAVPGSAEYVQLAITMTFWVGVLQIVMAVGKMGTIVNFISHAVILGFASGAGLLIAFKQLGNFFGVPLPGGLKFYQIVDFIIDNSAEINWYAAAVGGVTLLTGILLRTFVKRFPYMIGGLIAGGLTAIGLTSQFGIEVTQIKTIGALTSPWPPFTVPQFGFDFVSDLAGAIFATALIGLTMAVSAGRAIAVKTGQSIDSNKEFWGQGLANLAGAFFGSYVSTGSLNRTALCYEAGGKTPLTSVFSVVFLVVILLLVAPYASYIPLAAMAGILFLVAWSLIDFSAITTVIKLSKSETLVLVVTFGSTLFFDLEFAILNGSLLALLVYLSKTSRPKIVSRIPDPMTPQRHFVDVDGHAECPQLKIIRIDGSLFFGALDYVDGKLRTFLKKNPNQKFLWISAIGINFLDIAAIEYLRKLVAERRDMGGDVFFYRMKPGMQRPMEKAGLLEEIGLKSLLDDKFEGLSYVVELLDDDICRTCKARVFRECSGKPGGNQN